MKVRSGNHNADSKYRIIGVQSFKGSMRRTCVLNPTLGEGRHLINGQFCGGHIDPVTLDVTGYIQLNNETSPGFKGFICPLGQTCMVRTFPSTKLSAN